MGDDLDDEQLTELADMVHRLADSLEGAGKDYEAMPVVGDVLDALGDKAGEVLHGVANLRDRDGDRLTDGEEEVLGTNPIDRDTDSDGLDDKDEVWLTSNPRLQDTDRDGISDYDEMSPYLEYDRETGLSGMSKDEAIITPERQPAPRAREPEPEPEPVPEPEPPEPAFVPTPPEPVWVPVSETDDYAGDDAEMTFTESDADWNGDLSEGGDWA
jgi:hypothetical protein